MQIFNRNSDWKIEDMIYYAIDYYEVKIDGEKLDDDTYRKYSRKLRRVIGEQLRENKDYWIGKNTTTQIDGESTEASNLPYVMTEANAKFFIQTNKSIREYFMTELACSEKDIPLEKGRKQEKALKEVFARRSAKYCREEHQQMYDSEIMYDYEDDMYEEYEEPEKDRTPETEFEDLKKKYCQICDELIKNAFIFWCMCKGTADDFLKLNGVDSDKFQQDIIKLIQRMYMSEKVFADWDSDYAELLYHLKHPEIYYPLSKEDKEKYLQERKEKKSCSYWVPPVWYIDSAVADEKTDFRGWYKKNNNNNGLIW